MIKSHLLYQLSYGDILAFWDGKDNFFYVHPIPPPKWIFSIPSALYKYLKIKDLIFKTPLPPPPAFPGTGKERLKKT